MSAIAIRVLQHRTGFRAECDLAAVPPEFGPTSAEALGRLVRSNQKAFGIDLVVEHQSVADLPDPANDVPRPPVAEAVCDVHGRDC